MKVSQELLQKIKSSISILDVVGEHVVLRKSGANAMGLCPFHTERSPSFSVNESKQLYHCYGCKKGGDLVTFVMEILGVSFSEAVEDLADRAKISLPSDWEGATPASQQQDAQRREKLALTYKLNRFAASFFHQTLSTEEGAQAYFRDRGIGAAWIKSFYLGAVSESWDSLARHLALKKAPLDVAVELGLIRPSTKVSNAARGPGYFDLFRNRVMFPIINLRGKIAGFGGRVLGADDTPKYLNSPESVIFQKGKLAFGLFQAQKYIREQDEIVIVEGYFDVLAMHAAGFQNVVATCGTALTLDHLNQFRRLASRVVLLFDGDDAGIAATLRAMELGLDQGQVFYGVELPQGMDPDEMVLKPGGVEKMSALLKNAKPLLDVKMEEAIHSAQKGPEERVQALKKVGGWLNRFRDPVGKGVRLQLFQNRMGVSQSLILETLGTPLRREGNVKKIAIQSRPEGSNPVQPPLKVTPTDRILFGSMVFGGEYSKIFSEVTDQLPQGAGPDHLFSHPLLRQFAARILSEPDYSQRLRKSPATLIESDLDPQLRSILTESLLWSEPPFTISDLKGAIFKCQGRVWERFSHRIKGALSVAEVNKDVELQARLMKDYLDVQRKMKEFSSFYDQE